MRKVLILFLFTFCYFPLVQSQSISWVKSIAGDQFLNYNGYTENGHSIIVNESNVFVSGLVTGTQTNMSGNLVSEGNFCFLACYDLQGNLVWWEKIPGWGITDLAFDQSGNVIVSGEDDRNIFIQKYSSSGELLFHKDFFTDYTFVDISMMPNCLTIDRNDNILISGSYFLNTEDTVFVADTFITGIAESNRSAFILKCTPNGEFKNFFSSNFTGNDKYDNWCRVMDINVDSQNYTYLTGYYNANPDSLIIGDVKINSNYSDFGDQGDIFIVKLDSLNKVVWIRSYGGNGDDYGMKLSIDKNDNLYFVGSYYDNLCIGDDCLSALGGLDILIGKLNSDGDLVWLKSAGGQLTDAGRSIFVDENDDVYISGSYFCIAKFGEGEYSDTVYISNETSFTCYSGGFIAKYSTNGDLDWVENMQGKTSSIYDVCKKDQFVYLTGYFFPNVSLLGHNMQYAYGNTNNVFIISMDETPVNVNNLIDDQNSVAIYPNPSNGYFKIDIGDKKAQVFVYDLNSKLIYEKNIHSNSYIDLSEYKNGVYFIKILVEDKYYTKKIIKF